MLDKELREMAQEAREWIVDLAAGRRQWRMCIPPQSDDTDIVLMRLYKEFLAALDRVEELERERKSMVRAVVLPKDNSDFYIPNEE